MVHPADFSLGKIQKAIKLFVEYFDRALDHERRVYPRGDGKNFVMHFSMQGFLGGGSRAFIEFWDLVGIIFIAVLIMIGAEVSSLQEYPTHRMIGQYACTECMGKPCISLHI